jgi:hypothetical protein
MASDVESIRRSQIMAGNDNLWQQYAKQIIEIAAPQFDPSRQQFSLAASTLSVDPGNADPAIANDYVFGLGDTIPAAAPAYAPGSRLLAAYRLFLDSIDVGGAPDPDIDAQINMAASERTTARTNFNIVQAEAVEAWNSNRAITRISPSETMSRRMTRNMPTPGTPCSAPIPATTSSCCSKMALRTRLSQAPMSEHPWTAAPETSPCRTPSTCRSNRLSSRSRTRWRRCRGRPPKGRRAP